MSLWLGTSLIFAPVALGGSKKAKTASKAQVVQKKNDKAEAERRFHLLTEEYRTNKITASVFWKKLNTFGAEHYDQLSLASKTNYNQIRANILGQDGYPLLASFYAADAIKIAANPLDDALTPSWKILESVSKDRPIQYILENLAGSVRLASENPPAFGNDFNYILGNSYAGMDKKRAISYYRRLRVSDRYFMAAQYQLGLLEMEEGNIEEAKTALGAILLKNTLDYAPVKANDKLEMWNYANMALARLYYENKDFLKSVSHYRKVTRESPLFYDALFEQSWALFMSGNPLHALGSLYGVSSPFFADKFNPEAKLLESMIYYWLCRYEDSRNALVEFSSLHADAIASLRDYLDRKRLSPEAAYQLFENLVSGVSADSLGMPKNILSTAARSDAMLLLRDQLATLLGEKQRLANHGVMGSLEDADIPRARIDQTYANLRRKLGEQYIVELQTIKTNFDTMYEQSQFLNLELLMSRKEQLMGGELHSATKVSFVSGKHNIDGWSRSSLSWVDEKGEFWWDEIGYQIIDIQPQCNIR